MTTFEVPARPHIPVDEAVRRPGWWRRNWKWAVPAGVVLLIAGMVGLCVLLVSLIFGLVRNNEVYANAVRQAKAEPAVVDALGAPIEEGFMFAGEINVTPTTGDANLAIPIAGPLGEATIFVEAEKNRGVWTYYTLEVAVHDADDAIDLLAGR